MAGNGDSHDLQVTGPGGFGLRASGREIMLLVVLLAGLTGNAWILREGFQAIVHSNENVRSELREEFRALRGDHEIQRRNDSSLVCILAVPPDERTTAFRSGDVCGWILSQSGPWAPPGASRSRERPDAIAPPGFTDRDDRRPRPRLPQVTP